MRRSLSASILALLLCGSASAGTLSLTGSSYLSGATNTTLSGGTLLLNRGSVSAGSFGSASIIGIDSGIILAGSNTYAGTANILGGTLTVNNPPNVIGTTPITSDASIQLSNSVISPLSNSAHQILGDTSQPLKLATIRVGVQPPSQHHVLTLSTSLTKTGAGTLQLSGSNTYTRSTNISSGTIVLNGGGNSVIHTGSGAFVLGTNNTPTFTGSLSAGSLSISASVGGTIRTLTPTNFASNVPVLATTTNSLIKSGAGTLQITGASTFTGGIVMSAGNLAVGNITLSQPLLLYPGVAGVSGPNLPLSIENGSAYLLGSKISKATLTLASGDTSNGTGKLEITPLAGANITFASAKIEGGHLLLNGKHALVLGSVTTTVKVNGQTYDGAFTGESDAVLTIPSLAASSSSASGAVIDFGGGSNVNGFQNSSGGSLLSVNGWSGVPSKTTEASGRAASAPGDLSALADAAPVPEPSSGILLAVGAALLGARRRR